MRPDDTERDNTGQDNERGVTGWKSVDEIIQGMDDCASTWPEPRED